MKSSFGFTLIMAAGLAMCASDMAMAQPGSGRGFRGGGGWFGGGDSTLGLLQNEKIREDLELVDDQVDEFQALRDEMTQGMRDMWQGMGDLSREERREKFEELRTEMESRRKELDARVEDLLLPYQQKRLKQLAMQSQARRQGGALGFVASDRIVEELDITDEQQDKLKETAEEVRKDLDEKIRKLRKKAEEKILSVLTSEQRKKYEEMLGESFEFDDRNRGEFRNGRDRGGERGDRGGRRGRGGNDDRNDF